VADAGGRVAGSRVAWSSRWEESLHDELLRWILAAIGIDGRSR
jgi:hypothetical protein